MEWPTTLIRENDLTSEVFDSDGTVAIMMGSGLDMLHISAPRYDGTYLVRVFPNGEAEAVEVTVQGPT